MSKKLSIINSSFRNIFIFIFFALLLVFCILYFPLQPIVPVNVERFAQYDKAVETIVKEQQQDKDILDPNCVSKFLDHGKKTTRVIVLFHGYTSCPAEFAELGQRFFESGYNVYIPRAPYHGYQNKLTDELAKFTGLMYTRFAQERIAVAGGLGDSVNIIGFSGGGALASWAAQNIKGIDTAMIISPAIGVQDIPEFTVIPVVRILETIPGGFRWWDENDKGQNGAPYEYPRYSVSALAHILHVGRSTLDTSFSTGPLASKVIFIHNENDTSISHEAVKTLEKNWEKQANARINSYTFAKNLNFSHPFVDPFYAGSNKEMIFAKLLELFN